jgi:7-carboxy-7-deazaguanine synthase
MSEADILDQVANYAPRHVTVTGGEPLAQRACLALLAKLCDAGYDVSLETSGALDIADVDARVSRVVDLKTPGSGEAARNRWENIELLRNGDEIKFVLVDELDYHWARNLIIERRLSGRCTVLLSPSHGNLDPKLLAGWILRDRLPVRMQLQLHKILWGEERGR